MRSTRRPSAYLTALAFVLSSALGGCGVATTAPGGSVSASSQHTPPTFELAGSRDKSYADLKSLAKDSSNVILAEFSGKTRKVPLPDFARNPMAKDTAPNIMVAATVSQVLSGKNLVKGDHIEVVAFSLDTEGTPSLAKPGRYLLFLGPYIFIEPDRPPVTQQSEYGGVIYAITGGPAGMFYQPIDADNQQYVRVDNESPGLPSLVMETDASLPTGWTDEQYIAEGGPYSER